MNQEKRAQVKGFLELWKNVSLIVNMLQMSWRSILGLQAEKHDPVKQVHQLQFTMAELQIINNNMLNDDHERITYYKCFRDSLTKKNVEDRPD